MGAHSRSKGKRGERDAVRLARAAGLDARRTWHTAQSADAAERCCDVKISGRPFQVKRERDGFSKLYSGLAHVQGLFIKSDGQRWLIVLSAEEYLHLLRINEVLARSG